MLCSFWVDGSEKIAASRGNGLCGLRQLYFGILLNPNLTDSVHGLYEQASYDSEITPNLNLLIRVMFMLGCPVVSRIVSPKTK